MQRTASRIISLLPLILLSAPALADNLFVYFGSHGSGPHIGFSLARFDTDTGKLTKPVFLEEAVAPAYFIIRPDGRRLYTCNSSPGSSVSAYEIDSATGKLTFLNQQPSGGGDPSYVSLDPSGRYLMVANYLGGSASVFALRPDGGIGKRTAIVQHVGAGRFLYVTNRGEDSVPVVSVQPGTGRFTPVQHISTLGKTPRDAEFDPTGKWLLVSNQDSNNAVVFRVDPSTGQLTQNGDPVSVPAPFCERFVRASQ